MTYLRLPLAGICLLFLNSSLYAAEGQKIYTQGGSNPAAMACTTCHTPNGMGMAAAGFPRLAGLSANYLRKQLADFKSGTRQNPIMQPIAQALTDDESQAISQWLAQLPSPQYPQTGRAALVDSPGAVLALRGAWDRNIPECVSCHGPSGVGVGTEFPPLAGQSAQYLSSQLNAWRQGLRKNDPNDLMGRIARAMSEDEVKAASDYFSHLTTQGGAQ